MSEQVSAPAYPSRAAEGDPGRSEQAQLWPLVAAVTVIVVSYIGLSVVIAPPAVVDQYGTALPFNFKSERGSITLLSSTMFLIAGCVAARALLTVWPAGGRSRLLWLSFTVLMGYFCIDEVIGFHEELGEFLDERVSSGPFRTWNDVVVIAYGIVALPLALLLWREVLRYARLLPMLIVTGVLYVGTSSVDTLVENSTPLSVVAEEGIKLCCSTYFMLSMLTGLVAVQRMRWPRAGGSRTA